MFILLFCEKSAAEIENNDDFRFNAYRRLQAQANSWSDMDPNPSLLDLDAHVGRRLWGTGQERDPETEAHAMDPVQDPGSAHLELHHGLERRTRRRCSRRRCCSWTLPRLGLLEPGGCRPKRGRGHESGRRLVERSTGT